MFIPKFCFEAAAEAAQIISRKENKCLLIQIFFIDGKDSLFIEKTD
jgi:hypothetical protein